MLLKVKNLKANRQGKEILKGIDLEIKEGEVIALLGPNASGKSTLAQVLIGNPEYQITQGDIFFKGKKINRLLIEKRVKMGMVLVFQSPPAIEGVKLKEIVKNNVDFKEFDYLLERNVNQGFSGGEKKISELMQVLSLHPQLIILDEIDAGLDLKKLDKVINVLKKKIKKEKIALLIITHQGELLKKIKPSMAKVIINGKIICSNKDFKKVLKTIKIADYEKCKHCKKY